MKSKNLLFVHDHFFFKDSVGRVYSSGGLPGHLWDKYLKSFSTVTVVGRNGGLVSNVDGLVLSSHENVTFVLLESFASLVKLRNFRKVFREIKNQVSVSDAVVCRLPSENGLLAASLARKFQKAYAIEVVGCAWDALWNHGSLVARFYAPILYFRMRSAVYKSEFVLYVTSFFLQNRYPHNPHSFVSNASNVDVSLFDESVIARKIERIKKIKSKKIIFGLIGHYKTKYKGVHIAIEALGELKKKRDFSNFEFRILGKGDSKQFSSLIEKYGLQNHIKFCGTVASGTPVLEWLDDIDIQLHPSLQEGLPRAIIESMSRGNICIGSDTAGIPELIGKEMCATANSVASLAELIWKVFNTDVDDLLSINIKNFEHSKQFDSSYLQSVQHKFYHNLSVRSK